MKITSENRSRFERLVSEVMAEHRAMGAAVAIVNGAGETLYEQCFGYRDKNKQLPVTSETIFGLASVTKSFTCLSIMQLAEAGIIDVDRPVSSYLPEFTVPGVTVAHLMSHSGGFFPQPRIQIRKVAEDMHLSQEKDGDFAYHVGLAETGAKLTAERLSAQTKLIGRPGEYFSYCNDGYALLSAIVKEYGGERTFADYLNKHILQPLGMTRSGCDFLFPRKDENVTRLYKYKGEELLDTDDYCDNAFVLLGNGGMKSTLNDMKNYIYMYLNYGQTPSGSRIASSYTIREMTKPRMISGINSYYGYGLRMKPMDDLRIIEHGGGLTGVSSNMSFSYEADCGVMVLCNTSDAGAAIIADAAMKMARNREYVRGGDVVYSPVTWESEKLAAACGTYVSGEGAVVTIVKNGEQLFFERGEERYAATPINPYMLQVEVRSNKMLIKVYADDSGAVWGIGLGSRIVPKS
jgi:CubicO group peptidase (beta-lactamase class C family)